MQHKSPVSAYTRKATGLQNYFLLPICTIVLFCRYRLFSILLKKRIFISETRWYQVFKFHTLALYDHENIFSMVGNFHFCSEMKLYLKRWAGWNRGGNQRLHQSRGSPKIPSAKKDKQDSNNVYAKRDMWKSHQNMKAWPSLKLKKKLKTVSRGIQGPHTQYVHFI